MTIGRLSSVALQTEYGDENLEARADILLLRSEMEAVKGPCGLPGPRCPQAAASGLLAGRGAQSGGRA